MAEEVDKTDGWGIFDRLKNLPHVMTVKGTPRFPFLFQFRVQGVRCCTTHNMRAYKWMRLH